MDPTVTIGYVIFYITILGSATVIGLLTLKAIFKAYSLFKSSSPKKKKELFT